MDFREKQELLEFFMIDEADTANKPNTKLADYSNTERKQQAMEVAKKAMIGSGIIAIISAGKKSAVKAYNNSPKLLQRTTTKTSGNGWSNTEIINKMSPKSYTAGAKGAIWGAASLGVVLFLIYRYLIDGCRRQCLSSTDPGCVTACRIKKTQVIIAKLKSEMGACAKTQNPEKCKKKIQSYITKYEAKIQELQAG